MRSVLIFLLCLTACGRPAPDPPSRIDSIEILASGLLVNVNSDGTGRYEVIDDGATLPAPPAAFRITPAEFGRLLNRLARLRQKSGETHPTAQDFINTNCPQGRPYVTDQGTISVRWRGPNLERLYIADLGCDPERNADDNRQMIGALESLPVPARRPLP
ncbi:hypothetical protein [Sphingomonas sp. G-3-2-10]|uniref:hypothetical protein n=1 Tax=Sphingomonas sp. G-3-2-10 TaxID=2728838 RepID=UPI00146D046E|nr:hypothetical protein [Sphingomonas sp. G-3-2-10]NML05947.1 hypothetical protein [Sphingomonas sp. G-3-2-10]